MEERKRFIKVPLLIVLVFALMITNVLPAQAKSAVKLKNSKITLSVGKTKTLKVVGTNKKVKWSTSNSKVATVNSKGKVKAKKKGTCKVYAKVGKKKFTCKVTVKKKSNVNTNNGNTNSGNNVSWRSYGTKDGVVILAKNNFSYTVGVDVDCLFYDSRGTLLAKGTDVNYALEPGRECALFAWDSDCDWSSHKINLKVLDANGIVSNVSGIDVSFNAGNENVMVEVRNNGRKVFSTQIAVVFYKNNTVIGYRSHYADVNNFGSADYLEFPFPYDSNYNTVVPDRYVVYVNHSYTYTWMN